MHRFVVPAGAAFALWLYAAVAQAAPIAFHVTIDTTPLIGHADGPFAIDFQLIDGSGLGNGNASATLSDFAFTGVGAGPTGAPTTTGGAGGALDLTVTLTDTAFFNEFYQAFLPGGGFSFRVTLDGVVEAGPTPDAFSFAILDQNLFSIPTTGLGDALLLVNITGTSLVGLDVQTFASTSPAGVDVAVTPVPEPATLLLLSAGLVGATSGRRGRKGLTR